LARARERAWLALAAGTTMDVERLRQNPNYLNSVKEDLPDAASGRDLIMVKFGADARVELTCYDDGCKGVGK
jgi:hypothetical protein